MENTSVVKTNFLQRQFGKFFGYIVTFVKEELDWKYLLFLVAFLGGAIYWAYPDGTYNFYRGFRSEWVESLGVFWYHFILYGTPFVVAYGGFIVFKKRYDLLTNMHFWLLAIFAITVFAFRQSIVYNFDGNIANFGQFPRFTNRLVRDFVKMAAAMVPVTIYWLWDRKSSPSPYGFTLKNFNLRPYFIILLVMLPFVVGFGLTDHFGGYYPRGLKSVSYYFGYGVDPPQAHLLFYELVYGLDFVSIEYFFRGFLVIAFIRFVGPGSILPMACFYVSIHFGKPMVETISSFFGGSLLGILTLYSRSIWGGIVVHMGIAWLMELGAFLGKVNN